jgi:transposase, IS30 family
MVFERHIVWPDARFSQDYLNRIARPLNQRPRKTLGFETPADRLQAVLH